MYFYSSSFNYFSTFFLNNLGKILKSKYPVIKQSDKRHPLLQLEPNDEATFSIELITNLVSSSSKEDSI